MGLEWGWSEGGGSSPLIWANWFAGRSPSFGGRRQPSRDGTSRMMREDQVRICERLGVKFPGPTRQQRRLKDVHCWPARPSIREVRLGTWTPHPKVARTTDD